MLNFVYQNPVKVVFGKGSIEKITELIPISHKILLTYGGGSIKRNGVYDQIGKALSGHTVFEFGGIEPNPQYATLMKAVEIARSNQVQFLLAVGGGSVVDGTKFIAAAVHFPGDPWEILSKWAPLEKAVPLGCVLTLAATGTEMNANSVISREETKEKLFFSNPLVLPQFSILDPETTFSLPERQTINGIVDAFVHVMEQYMTYPVNAPLQDRQSEAILLTLIEQAPKVLKNPSDYDARANIMWCATHALNNIIGCGVPQDWSTHMIGHELTAFYGIDHAQSLAIVLPGILSHQKHQKSEKLIQYAERVWNVTGTPEEKRDVAIAKTEEFFRSLGMATRLSEYKIGSKDFETIAERLSTRLEKIGERQDIGREEIIKILSLRSPIL